MNADAFEKAMRESPGGLPVSDGSRYEPVDEDSPLDARRVVTSVNTLIGGISVRAIIFEIDPTHFVYEIRIDGHLTPDSRAAGVFPTAWGAVQSAKTALERWMLEVLERA